MKTALTVSEVESTDCGRFIRRFKVSGCSPHTPFGALLNAEGVPKMSEPYKPGSNFVAYSRRIIMTTDPLCFVVSVHYAEKSKITGSLTNVGEAVGLDAPTGGAVDD